jgi:peptide chain release factor 1
MLDDPEMREMAQEELRDAKDKGEQLEQQLQVLHAEQIAGKQRRFVAAGPGAYFHEGVTLVIGIFRLAGGDPQRQRR